MSNNWDMTTAILFAFSNQIKDIGYVSVMGGMILMSTGSKQ